MRRTQAAEDCAIPQRRTVPAAGRLEAACCWEEAAGSGEASCHVVLTLPSAGRAALASGLGTHVHQTHRLMCEEKEAKEMRQGGR